MVSYIVKLEHNDNGTLLVTCPDLPGVTTFGEERPDATAHAVDAIETWIASLMADGLDVARPRRAQAKRDEAPVTLPALTALKLELYWAVRDAKITRAELMRRLGWNRESVDRLFRLDHASKLDQLEATFAAIGKRVNLKVENVA